MSDESDPPTVVSVEGGNNDTNGTDDNGLDNGTENNGTENNGDNNNTDKGSAQGQPEVAASAEDERLAIRARSLVGRAPWRGRHSAPGSAAAEEAAPEGAGGPTDLVAANSVPIDRSILLDPPTVDQVIDLGDGRSMVLRSLVGDPSGGLPGDPGQLRPDSQSGSSSDRATVWPLGRGTF